MTWPMDIWKIVKTGMLPWLLTISRPSGDVWGFMGGTFGRGCGDCVGRSWDMSRGWMGGEK